MVQQLREKQCEGGQYHLDTIAGEMKPTTQRTTWSTRAVASGHCIAPHWKWTQLLARIVDGGLGRSDI